MLRLLLQTLLLVLALCVGHQAAAQNPYTPPSVTVLPEMRSGGLVVGSDGTTTIRVGLGVSTFDGQILKSELLNAGTVVMSGVAPTAPTSFAWTGVRVGTYALSARVTDSRGTVATSAPVSVTVRECSFGGYPSVSPARAVYEAPAQLVLSSARNIEGCAADRIEFLVNGTPLVGGTSTVPGTVNWPNVAAGVYQVSVRATRGTRTVTSAAVQVRVVAASVAAGTLYYVHTDHLGTPRLIEDQAQRTVWRWDQLEPFGLTGLQDDPDGDGRRFEYNLRFAGQYFDAESQLHHNGARDYDPVSGRYIQPDPIGLAGGISLYGYVGGNPLGFVDPLGLARCEPEGAAAKGAADFGRAGKEARLRELANDDKLGSADRGWIKQELNSIDRGQRSTIRNPPGKDLAHERGREAAKGYDYGHSNLQDRDLHRLQHKYDDFGRANAERPVR